ncbi:PLAT/LH2 domain-containing protein [Brevibacillus halotolerans]|uniref:PLAT/LH2 domain-containing protein n=1 Tax=Brevibacillus TaxID=55080 RepID=UPI00215B9408|nr:MULTISPECIES: PLAT/LH2 domain-containing protein [Brevibacillus]MCR8966152.1 PLAT/LH2 domain-containing protein [Brevibacillus laterosporus]MCZ0838309.1 PLAT/LH2 domain-containing protein [Brevibacillus halotolerans]
MKKLVSLVCLSVLTLCFPIASLAAPIEAHAKISPLEKVDINYYDGYHDGVLNEIIIETDTEADSGTDANISIALYGKKYYTDPIRLNGEFENGDKETFYLLTEKPIDGKGFGLFWEKRGWKPAWKVKSVTINDKYYKIDKWMGLEGTHDSIRRD